ncbi:MAG: tyrosine-type recombinase/integrase [Xanthobacteraceae bacterium]
MAIEKRIGKDRTPAYRVRIATHDPSTGKRRNVTIGTFARKKDAEAAERDAQTKRERGTLLDPATTTVSELLDAWLATKRGAISANSLRDYDVIIRKHLKPALGRIRVQAFKADRVQAQYALWRDAGLSPRLIRGCGMRLSQALDYAVRMHLVYVNVAKHAEMPKLRTGKPDVWTAHELRRFLVEADKDALAPLWRLLAGEGMRRGEALGLRWQDINWQRGTAHIVQTVAPDKSDRGKAVILERTKTAAGSRSVKLTADTLAALKAHKKRQAERQLAAADWRDHDLIVCTSFGTPVNPGNVSRSYAAILKRAGLRRIRVHDLRHTHATLLLLAGIPAKIVSERLGHASISITLDTYSHVLPDMQDEAADAFSRILASAKTGS